MIKNLTSKSTFCILVGALPLSFPDNNIGFMWKKGLFYGSILPFPGLLIFCLYFLEKQVEHKVSLKLEIWFWKLIYIMQIIRKYLSRNLIYFSHSENGPNSWEACQEIISFYTQPVIVFSSDWLHRSSQKHSSTETVAAGVCVQIQGRKRTYNSQNKVT